MLNYGSPFRRNITLLIYWTSFFILKRRFGMLWLDLLIHLTLYYRDGIVWLTFQHFTNYFDEVKELSICDDVILTYFLLVLTLAIHAFWYLQTMERINLDNFILRFFLLHVFKTFLIILKRTLENYKQVLKICFLCIRSVSVSFNGSC